MNSRRGKGITEAAIYKGVESLSRSRTFITTASLYLEIGVEMTSSSGSFRSGSSNRLKSALRASREGGNGVSTKRGVGEDEVEAFPLPLFVLSST